ncbi:MAG: transposase [Lachnospiraceae bacterium]|nr:transposase [Lachnospiraceae bacterium]
MILLGFLSALILQKIFSIPSDSPLLLFLKLYREFRKFCGFSKVPDGSLLNDFYFSRASSPYTPQRKLLKESQLQ